MIIRCYHSDIAHFWRGDCTVLKVGIIRQALILCTNVMVLLADYSCILHLSHCHRTWTLMEVFSTPLCWFLSSFIVECKITDSTCNPELLSQSQELSQKEEEVRRKLFWFWKVESIRYIYSNTVLKYSFRYFNISTLCSFIFYSTTFQRKTLYLLLDYIYLTAVATSYF